MDLARDRLEGSNERLEGSNERLEVMLERIESSNRNRNEEMKHTRLG